MKKALLIFSLIAGLTTLQSYANAASNSQWKLSADESKVAYGSIKKNSVGEVNHFKNIFGHIDKNGNTELVIDVTSVETFIDIRNQRMIKHVFDAESPKAILKSTIDLQEIKNLKSGQTTSIDVDGTLSLSGRTIEIETTMFVASLGKNKFIATTDEMIMVKTEELGINEGVDMLMKLAKLNGITRVVPVSLRMVFEK